MFGPNTITEMNSMLLSKVLPFYKCSDKELFCELITPVRPLNTRIPYISETNYNLYLQLPFHSLSDYSIMHECMTSKDKL